MKSIHRSFLWSLLLVFLAAVPLRAQWSGSADISTGLGGMTGDEVTRIGYLGHILAQGNLSLRYRTDKFSWSTALNGKWEPQSNDNTRLNLDLKQQEQLGLELVYKTVKTRPLQVGFRSDFEWKPAQDRKYAAWVSYRYKNDRARNVSNSLSGTLHLDEMDTDQLSRFYESPGYMLDIFNRQAMDSQQASCYYELPRLNEHNMGTGARGEWKLNDKSLLQGSVSLSTTRSRKHTTWSVFKTTQAISGDVDVYDAFHRGQASMYRITPSSIDLDFSSDFFLKRTARSDSVRVWWGPGIRVSGNHSLDYNSGATLSEIAEDGSYIWKDSLRLKENFNYLSIIPSPYVAYDYSAKKLSIHADYSLQFWLFRLNDDTRRQGLNAAGPNPYGNASLSWKISDKHKLGVTHAVGAEYPSYLQMCWYDRTGGYIDQLYRGNVDLAAALYSRYGMTYELSVKRFRYRMTNGITRKINEIDQTWDNEEIEGRLYKVFHWVNASDSWSFGTSHRFGWEGKVIKGGVGVEYNQSRRTATTDGTVKDASDWRVSGDLKAELGKGWLIGADVRYQSKVATFFSSVTEYWELAARIQKKFKRVTLFFEGRDLLDKARQTTVESADGEKLLVDVSRGNRRLFLLGVQWNF